MQTSSQTPAPFFDRLDLRFSAIRACQSTGNSRGGVRTIKVETGIQMGSLRCHKKAVEGNHLTKPELVSRRVQLWKRAGWQHPSSRHHQPPGDSYVPTGVGASPFFWSQPCPRSPHSRDESSTPFLRTGFHMPALPKRSSSKPCK